jgi:hypothetical protein
MSLINVSLNLVAYADVMKTVNPSVKFSDLKWSLLGLPTAHPQMIPISLVPGETRTVLLLTRPISFTALTTFQIFPVPQTANSRLIANLGQRTGRNDGDPTTQWQVVRTANLVRLTYTGTGTAPDFTSILPGDGLTIENTTGFSVFNQGDFVITNVNIAGQYVEYVNPIAVNETVTDQVEIYSGGPVQVGDVLDISNGAFSAPNQGQFTILRVNDLYVEFANQNAVPETITGITTGVVIYPFSSQWMLLAVDQRIQVQFNGDTGLGVEVNPPAPNDLVNNPGLLLKRGKIFQLVMINPGTFPASGFVFLSE